MQTLMRDLVFTVIVVKIVGRPFLAWTRKALRAILGFSSRVFGSQSLSFVSQNADNTLVAWRLGATALANYALSYRVLMLPVQILGQTANRLVFPIFSRLNDEPRKQARYFLTATTSLALGRDAGRWCSSRSPHRWVFRSSSVRNGTRPIVPMQVLAIASILRAVVTVSGGVMLARGRADWALRWAIVTTAFLLAGFVVGLHWGINGVAWSYLLVGFPLAIIQILLVRRLIPFTAGGYLKSVAPGDCRRPGDGCGLVRGGPLRRPSSQCLRRRWQPAGSRRWGVPVGGVGVLAVRRSGATGLRPLDGETRTPNCRHERLVVG